MGPAVLSLGSVSAHQLAPHGVRPSRTRKTFLSLYFRPSSPSSKGSTLNAPPVQGMKKAVSVVPHVSAPAAPQTCGRNLSRRKCVVNRQVLPVAPKAQAALNSYRDRPLRRAGTGKPRRRLKRTWAWVGRGSSREPGRARPPSLASDARRCRSRGHNSSRR